MEFDVKNRLKDYMPSLFELFTEEDNDWKKIEKVFERKYNELNLKFETNGGPFEVKASFYGIVTQALQENISALRIFHFIDNLFQELAQNLNEIERHLIKKNVFDILISQDEKYLNYIGELATLNNVIKSGNYRLLEVEQELAKDQRKSSRIDFTLLNTSDKSKLFVEIVNVHLDENNTIDDQKIARLLDQKLREKVLRTAGKSTNPFLLAPILWGTHDLIRKILAYYNTTQFRLKDVLIPSCFIPFSDSDGNMVPKFGTIDTIFN